MSEPDAVDQHKQAQPEALPQGELPASDPSQYGVPYSTDFGQVVLYPDRDRYLDLIETLRYDGFVSAVDVCGVDYLNHRDRSVVEGVVPERYELVVNLVSHRPARRIRVRVQIPETDPVAPSLFDLFPGTEAAEREVYDLIGVRFTSHPDMTRILMPPDWQGHPLRKDFAVGAVPVQFKDVPAPR